MSSGYVLTCSAVGQAYVVAPVASGSNEYVLTPASSLTSGQNVVASCTSAAWVPYSPIGSWSQSDTDILIPAVVVLLATAAGLRYLIRFTGGRR